MAKKPVSLDLGETKIEITPTEETPTEETPAEETPTEETPVEETPTEETPTEETPAEETPAEETPTEETPTEETPTEETPVDPVVNTEASKVDPEGAKFVKAPDDDIWLMCVHSHSVYDPYTETRFTPGVAKFVTRMGSYTRNQKDAGLLVEVPAPTAGD